MANLINGLLPVLTILVNAAFVDQAMALFSQKAEVRDMVPALMGMLAILLWQNLSRTCLQYGEGVRERKLKETLQKAFLEKISNLEYRQLELSETQDLIQRVALAPEEHIKLTVESLEGLAILFLDEPTAAIDPLEESELYRHFERMCQGKTAVIVTHRMGCARIANRIVVLEKGKIVQLGTHEELYQEGGCYKRYWDVQAADYCG